MMANGIGRFNFPLDQSENLPQLNSLSGAAVWLQQQEAYRAKALVTYDLQNASEAPAYTRDDTNRVSFSAPQVSQADCTERGTAGTAPDKSAQNRWATG
jgi:hypothetical protein